MLEEKAEDGFEEEEKPAANARSCRLTDRLFLIEGAATGQPGATNLLHMGRKAMA
jgi:hypothetical protein